MEEKIDFVITWVDGNNSAWRKDFELYSELEGKTVVKRAVRFPEYGYFSLLVSCRGELCPMGQ